MSTAIAGKKLSTKRAEWDDRQRARQSKAQPDCCSTTIKSRVTKISLALSSRRDNHPPTATAEMAILIVAVFPSRLSRYNIVRRRRITGWKWWIWRALWQLRLRGISQGVQD